jgi:GDPmannose 4,6-dehydratase
MNGMKKTMKNNKTAIITGATGQDGSYLVELLLDKGYFVVGCKRRTSIICTERLDHVYDHPNFKLEYFDLNDVGNIYRLLMKYKPDEFYNLAAQSHVRVSFDIPEHTVDGVAMGTLRILEAIKNVLPTCRFYQASSSEMFGDNPENPQNEETALMPASPYACAKVFAHNLIRNYRESYGLHLSSGILFNHESPRRGETFVTRKITMAAARIKLGLQDKLYLGNLDAKRDWGFAGDYVEAMWMMLQQEQPDDYVVATGETHTVRQFLDVVFEYAGLDTKKYVEVDERLFRPHEVPLLLGDATKAEKKLGWKPKVRFNELAIMMYEEDLKQFKGEMK